MQDLQANYTHHFFERTRWSKNPGAAGSRVHRIPHFLLVFFPLFQELTV